MKKIKSVFISLWKEFSEGIARIITKFKKPSEESLDTPYKDLAPVDNVMDCNEHLKALNWAFANPRIKNIALAGPYGSGKSSLIQTFLSSHEAIRNKSMLISLATFSDGDGDEPIDVEEGILKQLFYKVEQKAIPQSRFRKIRKIRYWSVFGAVFAIVCLVGLITYVLWPAPFAFAYSRVIETGNQIRLPVWSSIPIFSMLIISTLMLVARFIQKCLFRFTIKSIKLPKETATVTDEPNESHILNKRIDEIVYFFEQTSFRIVFFEDLDRFKGLDIYVKLREINTLLNNYRAIKDPIVFVYAIRDDIFTSENRTKFFDFIIPVIPVINSTNSSQTFMSLLNVENGKSDSHNISEEYILDVAPFISDMRVLRNICNEFSLYKQTIKTNQGLKKLNDEVLMSLIIFKNLHPKQFALLQKEEGLVKDAFEIKKAFINSKKESIQAQINQYLETINRINEETLKSANEIKLVMLAALTEGKGVAYRLAKLGVSIHADKILQDDFDLSTILQDGRWTVYYKALTGSDTSRIEENIQSVCQQYVERIDLLTLANEKQQQHIRQEIASLTNTLSQLSTWSLQKLLSEFDTRDVFPARVNNCSSTAEMKQEEMVGDNLLLVFMLRKGYINEEYANYINFFKGKSMTIADKNFILSVKTQKPEEFTYKLSPPTIRYVISNLQPHEFSERAILNFDLLDYMLCSNEYDNKLELFIRQLTKESKDTREFINQFIDRVENQRRFVKMLAAEWPGWWEAIYDDPSLTEARKRQFLFWCCGYLNIETLRTLNVSGKLSKFIAEDEWILQEVPENLVARLQSVIAALGIRFSKVKTVGVPAKLLDFVFDNCYYEINYDTIFSIVENKKLELCDRLATQTYTTIKALSYPPLLNYIHDNFEVFVKEVLLRNDNTKEDISAVAELLERGIDSLELCELIISHNPFLITTTSDICQNHIAEKSQNVQAIWDMILQYDRLALSWGAIYDYWDVFKLTPELCKYIENNSAALSKQSSSCLTDEFKESIILSQIAFDAFERILSQMRMGDFSIRVSAISEDKLALMVQRRNFKFSVIDYEDLEEYKPELCFDFICLNQQDFVEHINEITLSAQAFEQLICGDGLKQTTKQIVVEHYGLTLMTPNVANHLCSITIAISREVFMKIWDCVDDGKKKYTLMVQHLDVLNRDDFEEYLVELGKPYNKLKRSASRHEEFIPDTPDNRALAERLTRVQYLTSYEFEKQPVLDARKEIAIIRCRVKAKA